MKAEELVVGPCIGS